MALNLGGTSGMTAAAQANPWAAGINAASQLGAAALNDKTNQTYEGALSQWFTFGDKNVNLGSGSIGTSRTEPLSAVAGQAASLLSNPLVLVLVGLVAYKVIKS
jgi:hypothetical protein